MKTIFFFLFSIALCSCHLNVEIKKPYGKYFDDSTVQTLKNGVNAYLNGKNKLADSLLTIVILNSKGRLAITMPRDANPYYYRGSNDIEVGKYAQALSDMDHVGSDTTTDFQIILVRCEAMKALKKYDVCIDLCNRLIFLKYDSVVCLSERGECYFYKGELDKACSDLNYCKRNGSSKPEYVAYLNQFLKDCK